MVRVFAMCSPTPGCGKDVVKDFLVKTYPAVTKGWAFANYLKEVAKTLGWNGEKDKRGRELLIDLGLTVRKHDINFWVNKVVMGIRESNKDFHVISDLRFLNEYEVLRRAFGDNLTVIGVERPGVGEEWKNDPSQVEYSLIPKNHVITNDGNLIDYLEKIDKIARGYYAN